MARRLSAFVVEGAYLQVTHDLRIAGQKAGWVIKSLPTLGQAA